jgi:hypothetical protein
VSRLFVALLHHPVLDRRGKTVTAAITSLDLHDLARTARTFGVNAVFLVHPVRDQRDFAERVLDHWRLGYGREFDSRRREALELMRVVAGLDEATAAIEKSAGRRPILVYTSARAQAGISFAELRKRLDTPDEAPILIMLGTGFGLAPAMMEQADLVLEPIAGVDGYNHLPVRAAAAIILDRLRRPKPR